MVRTILSILAGLITGFILIFSMEALTHSFYPAPPGMDFNNPEAVEQFMSNLPMGAMLMVLLGYMIGSYAGGLVAAQVALEGHIRNAVIVGALLTGSDIVNMLTVPHPAWFWVSLLVYIPLAWLGAKTALKLKRGKTEPLM
jgi:hypothetical protein